MKPKQQLVNTQITKQFFEGNDKKVIYMAGFPSYMTVWYYRATSAWRCDVKFFKISQVYPDADETETQYTSVKPCVRFKIRFKIQIQKTLLSV